MQIRRCTHADAEPWARLRSELWPEQSADAHRAELAAEILRDPDRMAAFLACTDEGEAVGLAEAALRRDYVNGCETTPVLFLEGVYVRPVHRRKGIARALLKAVEAWGRACGCIELGSDASIDNAPSHAFHAALGFEETERVVFFRKRL